MKTKHLPSSRHHTAPSRQRCAWLGLLLGIGASTLQAQTLPSPPVSPAPVVNYEYDAVGNPTKTVVAPGVSGLGLSTVNTYDNLQRRKDTTDPKAGKTQFGYDGADRLTQVIDPRNLVTQYARNGLGDNTQLVSPDTGTAGQTFDAAGNLKTRTDSRGVLSTHTYDALNRLTQVAHSKTGSTTETHSWTFDQTGTGYANGKGRLTSTTYPTGFTQYQYDPLGRLTVNTQRINAATGANSARITRTVTTTYDAAGQVTSITYPSGRKLTIGYTGGQASSISLAKDATSAATALISNIQWEPFGAPRSWEWQMATGTQAQSWSYDTNGRVTRYRLGDSVRDLTYDAADRITAYTHYNAATAAAQSSLNQSFSYDELGRIISSTVGTSTTTISYDANGNRITANLSGSNSSYTTPATSNRLTATTNPARTITYDAMGNPTGITGATASAYTATYNLAGRLATLTKGGATTTYAYDNDGRRIRKFISSGTGAGAASTVLFAYDQNDQLIGEYSSTGAAIREYVWLGNMPVAIFTPDPAAAANPPLIYYVQTDHLNTPRVVFNKANQIRWRWLAEPFGTTAPETNPSSLGNFTQPLRFPGQYADAESGLYYNHWRSYDPATGRYTQFDPIGLAGGSFSGYDYVNSNPTGNVDPDGLTKMTFPRYSPPVAGTGGNSGGAGNSANNDDSGSRDRARDSNQCTVYHIKDCAGETIYVGITSRDPRIREREHESGPDGKMNIYQCEKCKLSFREVAKYNDRKSCEYAETQDIEVLRPFANIRKNPDSGGERWRKYTEWWSKRCINCQ
jgi:RHS repeat-associated protein